MINLFRNIRQGLIKSGSTPKYLLYAIGEIALVVIGILIALQINNWNQSQKAKIYEIELLEGFRQDLVRDTLWANGRIERKDWINDALTKLAEMPEWTDSLYTWWEVGSDNIFMQLQTASYETLKSVGINSIRDDELRRSILAYYQGSEMQLDIITRLRDMELDKWLVFINEHFATERLKPGESRGRMIPYDYEQLRTDEAYVQLLINRMNSLDHRVDRVKRIKSSAGELLAEIDSHIDNR